MAILRRRIVSIRALAICVLVGVLLALVGIAAPVAVVRQWPDDPATRPGPMAWYVEAHELEPGTPSEPNRDVLIFQARLGGMVEEFRRVPDGVNVLMNYRIAEGYAEQERLARERFRQRAIEAGSYPPPRLPVWPRSPQALRDRTARSRALLDRIPDADTAFVRSGWPWRAGEGLTHPVRPVWGGLLANVVFFTVLALTPVLAWRAWRAWGAWRARRGAGSMAGRRHRIVSRGVVLKSAVAGLVLAIASVPVAGVAASLTQKARQKQLRQQSQSQTRAQQPTPAPAPTPVATFDWMWISTPRALVGFYRTDLPGGVAWDSTATYPLPEDVWPSAEWPVIEPADDPRPRFARPDFPGYPRGYGYLASGWPLPAAEGRHVIDHGPSPSTQGFRYERMYVLGFAGLDAEIPLRPIWLGLAANTVFYAAMTFPVLVVWRWRRTRRRRKKGRCVACGYQLDAHAQEGVCPECGLAATSETE